MTRKNDKYSLLIINFFVTDFLKRKSLKLCLLNWQTPYCIVSFVNIYINLTLNKAKYIGLCCGNNIGIKETSIFRVNDNLFTVWIYYFFSFQKYITNVINPYNDLNTPYDEYV